MLDVGVESEVGTTVWEATANLPPALAAPLWAYVAGLFDAPDLPALRTAALDIRRVIPGSATHFNELDLTGAAVVTLSDPPSAATPPVIAEYLRLRHEHPVVSHPDHQGGARPPLAISDVVDEAAFTATALYREVYSVIGMRDQLVIPVPLRRGRATVTLSVGREDWGFSEAEHIAALIIQRSLRVTYGSMWRRRSDQTAAGISTELLARSGVHVCVVDRFGEISDAAQGVDLDPLVLEAISGVGRLVGTTDGREPHGPGARARRPWLGAGRAQGDGHPRGAGHAAAAGHRRRRVLARHAEAGVLERPPRAPARPWTDAPAGRGDGAAPRRPNHVRGRPRAAHQPAHSGEAHPARLRGARRTHQV